MEEDYESNILEKIKIDYKECKIPNMVDCHDIFNTLGVYKPLHMLQEGEVVLYDKCIREYAQWFYDRNKDRKSLGLTDLNECIVIVYTIVLWHELGHWVTHWMKDSLGKRWDDSFWELEPNPNDLLEGLAQLITDFAIENEADLTTKNKLRFIFENMLIGQSEPYHKHKEIQETENYSIERCFTSLELLRDQFTNINIGQRLIKSNKRIEADNDEDIIERLEIESLIAPDRNKYIYRVVQAERININNYVFNAFRFFIFATPNGVRFLSYNRFEEHIYSLGHYDNIQSYISQNASGGETTFGSYLRMAFLNITRFYLDMHIIYGRYYRLRN